MAVGTPNIDRLAREGVMLTQHLAAASVCTPSRAAFLTGRYPIRSGMASPGEMSRDLTWLGGSGGLPSNETTFAKSLQHLGYRTGLVGKWHQGLSCASRDDHCHHPLNHGFDYFYGLPLELLSDCQPSRRPELHPWLRVKLWASTAALGLIPVLLMVPKFARWFPVPCWLILTSALVAALFFLSWYSSYGFVRRWNCVLMRNHDIVQQPMMEERVSTLLLREALGFIDRYKRQPFLLFVSFLHVHTPLITKQNFVGKSKYGLYGDNVEEMDWMVGKILAALDRELLANCTLVYFTSDNGGRLESWEGGAQRGGWNGVYKGMVSSNVHRVIWTLGAPAGLPRNETTFAALLRAQGYSTALIGDPAGGSPGRGPPDAGVHRRRLLRPACDQEPLPGDVAVALPSRGVAATGTSVHPNPSSCKWHQGLNCESRTDHCHHPHNYGFDYFYGMPASLFDECWPDTSRDTELALGKRVSLCVQLLAVAVLTFLLAGRWSRCLSVPWSLIVFLILLLFLLCYSWLSSFTSTLYWSCLLMRQHEITEQPLQAVRAGSIMLREALSFLERHREGPFLLFFSFLHVHTPLPTSDEFIGTSQHGLYGDNVQEMDFMVGKILGALDDLGLTQNTLVYFTSDHGGHLEARRGRLQLGGWNGIYRGGKGMGGWEGGIRVPGIVRWPGKVAAGKVIDEPTSLMDILPTLAAVSGARVPQDRVIDGRNLMPLLQGHTQRSEHEFLFHYCGSYLHAARWHPRDSRAVWKVHYATPVFQPPGAQACYETYFCHCSKDVVTYHDPPLLFDLSRDPSESTPLRRDTEPLYDSVVRTVADAVRRHRDSVTPVRQQLSELNEDSVWLRPCCGVFPFCLCDTEEGFPAAAGA
ncbi:PREDICTED: arylsulfatase F [Condylura cristata]|uniref:arylsulfatase F n=1 Tax=Condylura cristata TaxID=143302 RepID=UPI000643B52E|nr:PREDICTED: arylsulfatase F [Condylura cristata]